MSAIVKLSPLAFCIILTLQYTTAQTKCEFAHEEKITLKTSDCQLQGSMLIPNSDSVSTVVLFVSGSGPTDRDGNQVMMRNNSIKLLAYSLALNNIASVRFDKRGTAESRMPSFNGAEVDFGHFINDVKEWVQMLRRDRRFSKLVLIGHNEGALLAINAISSGSKVDAFISLAGVGRTLDQVLKDQLLDQPTQVREIAYQIIDTLRNGHQVKHVPIFLASMFTPSVQPFIISAMKHNPQAEIRKIRIPILIIQGENDIQVKVEDARLLNAANPNSRLVVIPGMNHVLKDCHTTDRAAQIATYTNPALPINDQLIFETVNFIRTL